jgi:hypothetical protein
MKEKIPGRNGAANRTRRANKTCTARGKRHWNVVVENEAPYPIQFATTYPKAVMIDSMLMRKARS